MRAGNRILIYGPSGAGKTTFANALGAILGLPVIELDAIQFAKPKWKHSTREEYLAAFETAIEAAESGWIVEGNDTGEDAPALGLADTIIWLRLPFRVTYPRLAWRTVRWVYTKELLWGGNRASWKSICGRRSFLAWGLYDWRRNQSRTRQRLRNRTPGTRVHIFRSQRAVDRFLASLYEHREQAAEPPRC